MAADTKRPVRGLFVILLLVLIVPSRLIAFNHRTNLAGFLGATTSTLLVCWFLYKLCLRATRQAWFIAISVAAVYVATFSVPLVAWVTLLVMYVVHRYTVGPATAVPHAPVAAETAPIEDQEGGPFDVLEGGATRITGGTIVATVQREDDKIGTGIDGGTPQKMTKGDFLLIPAGIPHQITDVQGVFTPLTLHLPMVK